MSTFKKANSKSKKLSTQLSIIMGALLILVFTVFISVAALMSSSALSSAISSDFSNNSEKNAAKVQSTIDDAAALGENLQYYMTKMYEDYEKQVTSDTVDQTLRQSDVTGTDILIFNKEIEDYISNTIKATVSNNDDIRAAGVYFEPYAFDERVREYSIYIAVDKINEYMEVPYSEYSVANYYETAKNTQKPYFTEPYDFDGVKMISASFPIIFQNKVQGVVVVDVNVTNFNQFAVSTDVYPTIFNEILTDKSTVVFDSTDLTGSYVGMNTGEWIKDAADLNLITNGYNSKQAFTLETVGDSGQRLSRFYYPLTAGDQTWWSLTALDSKDMNKANTKLILWLVGIAAISLFLIIVVTIIILTKKISPINQVVLAAEQIVNGDLDVKLDIKSNDEIGLLARSFGEMSSTLKEIISDIGYVLNEMSEGNFLVETRCKNKYVGDYNNILLASQSINTKLSDVLSQINRASEQVSAGSEQVSAGAQSLSQGATEQASSIEELAATITEISEQIKQNTNSAVEASEKSSSVGEEVQESNKRMNSMLQAMDEISNSSSEIGKIIKTIEDIAFQTNILALNAAVEAARAGAAGKGFAVVADEVRNLASKSAEASKNTAGLIEGSLRAVNNGTKIADETAKSLGLVVDGVGEVSNIIDRISEASKEQYNSINQVTLGVEQISAVVQTNAATSEESAASSEELSGQAQMLKELVSTFKLRDESGFSSTATSGMKRRTTSNSISIDLGMNSDKY